MSVIFLIKVVYKTKKYKNTNDYMNPNHVINYKVKILLLLEINFKK